MLVLYPDPLLRRVCDPYPRWDDSIRAIGSALTEIMTVGNGLTDGAGCAAPQAGFTSRVFVMMHKGEALVTPNPEILERDGEQLVDDGCLSMPGFYWKTVRSRWIRMRCMTPKGPAEFELEDFEAAVAQHEIDHLDGKLFIDHVPDSVRRKFYKKHGREEYVQ